MSVLLSNSQFILAKKAGSVDGRQSGNGNSRQAISTAVDVSQLTGHQDEWQGRVVMDRMDIRTLYRQPKPFTFGTGVVDWVGGVVERGAGSVGSRVHVKATWVSLLVYCQQRARSMLSFIRGGRRKQEPDPGNIFILSVSRCIEPRARHAGLLRPSVK
jgi:hypothetical protein